MTQSVGDLADEAWDESDVGEEVVELAKGHVRRIINLEVHQIVICVDFIAHARQHVHLVREFQDVLLLAETLGIDFKFDHGFVLLS